MALSLPLQGGGREGVAGGTVAPVVRVARQRPPPQPSPLAGGGGAPATGMTVERQRKSRHTPKYAAEMASRLSASAAPERATRPSCRQ